MNMIFRSEEYKESKGSNYKLSIKGWNNMEFKQTNLFFTITIQYIGN